MKCVRICNLLVLHNGVVAGLLISTKDLRTIVMVLIWSSRGSIHLFCVVICLIVIP